MSVAAPGQGMRSRARTPMMFSTAAMKIGDLVLYQGRLYYLRGLDPMSVPDRRVILEDRIPYQKVRGHWLVKQSDAETWRESRMQKPEVTLKSMVAGITGRVRREREKSSGVRLDEGFPAGT